MSEKTESKKIAKFVDNVLNKRIKELIDEQGVRGDDLAKVLSISPEAIRLWVAGYARPDVDKISILAKYFSVSSDYLLGISDLRYERSRFQYIETEKDFIQNINMLSDKEKSYLIHCLNYLLDMSKKIQENNKLVYGIIDSFSDLTKAIAVTLDEINIAIVRNENKQLNQEGSIPQKTLEVNINTLLSLDTGYKRADIFLNNLFKKLVTVYKDSINDTYNLHCTDSFLIKMHYYEPLNGDGEY